jgi:O-antigen/teichoic acid export membrane protein
VIGRLRNWRMPADPGGHSFRRYRGIILGGGFAVLSKLISVVTVALSVPLTLKYLGSERYGMWMTISSLFAVLSFADLGIGNGLVSALASSQGQRASETMVRLISSSFFMLVGLGLGVILVFMGSFPFVPWGSVFGVTSARAVAEAGPSVLAFIVFFAIGLPLTLVQRVQMGLQESWLASLWQSGGSVISLIGVLVAAHLEASVVWLVVAMNGGSVFASILNAIVEFGFRKPDLHPRWSNYDRSVVRGLLATGGIFVGLQLCVVIGTASDPFVIAQIFGASAVGPYSVACKLYQTLLVFGLFIYPLWPALGEALGRKDYAWARIALHRAIVLSVAVGSVLAAGFVLFGRAVIEVWLGGKIVPDMLVIGGFAACILMSAYGAPITSLLNNKEFLPLQLKMYATASIAALALKIVLSHWIGPSGVVWAAAAAYSLLYCLPARFAIRRYFRAATRGEGEAS